jgi:nucleotide-binding universal stress UspA family protein
MKVILVATDGSEGGTAALKEAVLKASAERVNLVVLTVAARDLGLSTMSEEVEEYAREEHLAGGEAEGRLAMAEDILAEAKEIVGDRWQLNASYISRAGDATEEILACVREWNADVLFLGSSGRSPLGAIFLGSVSRKVAGAARCSVIIVPTKVMAD